jgi:hypothetical protein
LKARALGLDQNARERLAGELQDAAFDGAGCLAVDRSGAAEAERRPSHKQNQRRESLSQICLRPSLKGVRVESAGFYRSSLRLAADPAREGTKRARTDVLAGLNWRPRLELAGAAFAPRLRRRHGRCRA